MFRNVQFLDWPLNSPSGGGSYIRLACWNFCFGRLCWSTILVRQEVGAVGAAVTLDWSTFGHTRHVMTVASVRVRVASIKMLMIYVEKKMVSWNNYKNKFLLIEELLEGLGWRDNYHFPIARLQENEWGKHSPGVQIFGSWQAVRPRMTQKFARMMSFSHEFSKVAN